MKERGQDNRLNGLKKAAGTAVLAVSLAACGSNNGTETQKPTASPTENNPTPTMTFNPTETPIVTLTPTPEPTPEITPEITPTPEPTPEPMPIETIIDSDYAAVNPETIKEEIALAYEQNTHAAPIYPNGVANFDECLVGIPGFGDQTVPKKSGCQFVIDNAYKVYKITGDMNFYKISLDTRNYAISPNGPFHNSEAELYAFLEKNN